MRNEFQYIDKDMGCDRYIGAGWTLKNMTDEDKDWEELIKGIEPLGHKPKHSKDELPAPLRRPKVKVAHREPQRDMPLTSRSPDLVSGGHDGIDRKLRKKMDEGEIRVEASIDLHHMTIEEAHGRVRSFLDQSYARALRLVLIVTGKGINTEIGRQSINQMLPIWLNAGDMRGKIVRFSAASPKDGGTGAFYVLLRRRRE